VSRLVALVDSGELRVDVAQRVPLAELPAVHTQAAKGVFTARSSSPPTA
jgi:NADPH:quinone reductase-like Zn-dependent oxidoreductase